MEGKHNLKVVPSLLLVISDSPLICLLSDLISLIPKELVSNEVSNPLPLSVINNSNLSTH